MFNDDETEIPNERTPRQPPRRCVPPDGLSVLDYARQIVRPRMVLGENCDPRKLQAEFDPSGPSHVYFEQAIAIERALMEEASPVDVSTLSLTAQKKFDLAVKQAVRQIEPVIFERARKQTREWLQGQLDTYNANAKHYEKVLSIRKGIMTKAQYRLILSCLHSDNVQDAGQKKRFDEAFNLFSKMEKLVLNEKESPTTAASLPNSVEELMKRRDEMLKQRAAVSKRSTANVAKAK